MNQRKKNLFDARTNIALFIIISGIVLLLENLGYIRPVNVWEWWPVILIAIGLGSFFHSGSTGHYVGGFVLLFTGVALLGNNLELFYMDWDILWPVFLILLGLLILKRHSWKEAQLIKDTNFINLTFVLSGSENVYVSKNLKGGKITAVMGGATIDLSGAEMEGNEIVLDVFSLMGGVDIRIPKHWQVNMKGMPFLGRLENKTFSSFNRGEGMEAPQTAKVLMVKGMAILGSVEILN